MILPVSRFGNFGSSRSLLPTQEVEEDLHHKAHEACYIANSAKTEITVDRQFR